MKAVLNNLHRGAESLRRRLNGKLEDEWPRKYFWAYKRDVRRRDLRFRDRSADGRSAFKDIRGETIDIEPVLDELLENGVAVLPYRLFEDAWVDETFQDVLKQVDEYRAGRVEHTGLFQGEYGVEQSILDTGIVRFYRPEDRIARIKQFAEHPLLIHIGEEYLRKKLRLQTTIAQYNEVSEKPCRGYHLDSWVEQFKSFIYLNDVDETNGPFSYLLKSHLNDEAKLRKMFRGYQSQFDKSRDYGDTTGYTDDEIAHLIKNEKRFTAPRGTVLLADTRGIHRGAALREGRRIALVNYYYTA